MTRAMWVVLALAACGKSGDQGSSTGSAEVAAPGVKVKCTALPGASRTRLGKLDDRSLQYIELVTETRDEGRTLTFNQIKLDIASGAASILRANVGEYPVVSKDQLVFTRTVTPPKGEAVEQLFVAPLAGGGTERALTPLTGSVRGSAIDHAKGHVYFGWAKDARSFDKDIPASGVYRVPLAGGALEPLGNGDEVHGWYAPANAPIVRRGALFGLLANQELTPLPIERNELRGTPGNRIVFVHDGATRSIEPTTIKREGVPDTVEPDKKLDIDATEIVTAEAERDLLIFGKTKSGFVTLTTDGLAMKRVMFSNVPIASSVALPDRHAVLVIHDTDLDGMYTQIDESDVCFVERLDPDVPVQFPSRNVPQRFVELEAKLRAVADSAKLAASRIRIWENAADKPLLATFYVPGNGSNDIAEQRAQIKAFAHRARQEEKRTLNVGIVYLGNGRHADSTWSGDRYVTSAGIGFAELSDPTEYALSIDPTVTTAPEWEGSMIGQITCSGTITNVSSAPIADVSASCSGTDENNQLRLKSVSLGTVAAGASAKYRVFLDRMSVTRAIKEAANIDGKPVASLNAYAQTKNQELLGLAAKIFDQTKLVFVRTDQQQDSTTGKPFRLVVLRVDASFADDTDREARATLAARIVKEHFTKDAAAVGLRLMENARQHAGWVWWADRLIKQ